MGYDTSFHPIDMSMVNERLLPYLAGHGGDDDIDDLITRAVELRKTRFRAKAWALGAMRSARAMDDVDFEPHLHVWGRPFFIVGDDVDGIAEDVRRYQRSDHEGVDTLATEMLARLDASLPGRVEPDSGGRLPDDAQLTEMLGRPMRVLRAAAVALRRGERSVPHPRSDGDLDAAELVGRDVPLNLLEFAANLLPGWMSRGRTWPTALYTDAGVSDEHFTAPIALTALLRAEFGDLDWPPPSQTIVANYMVGGLVPADQVAEARTDLARQRDRLKCDALDIRKIDEAMGVAARLGVAFCEATEIYSGMEGNLN